MPQTAHPNLILKLSHGRFDHDTPVLVGDWGGRRESGISGESQEEKRK
jgi:hypothetical protein